MQFLCFKWSRDTQDGVPIEWYSSHCNGETLSFSPSHVLNSFVNTTHQNNCFVCWFLANQWQSSKDKRTSFHYQEQFKGAFVFMQSRYECRQRSLLPKIAEEFKILLILSTVLMYLLQY